MSNDIESEIDDIIDNFDLKPITDGLGFHHSIKDEKEVKINLRNQTKSLKNELETRISQLDTNKSDTKVNMGDLAPFYADVAADTPTEETTLDLEKEVSTIKQEASLTFRLCAWFIDITILLTTILVIFTAIIFFAELPLEFFNIFMVSDELFISFIALSFMFYNFYFSFFDKTSFSTIGKRLMNLRVVRINGQNISYIQAFLRSCLTIVSLPLLGLPLILKFQDKITDTQVIED